MARRLIIQLERLGDLIQTTPLLQELRSAHPSDELDLLVLRETQVVVDGLAGVRDVYTLGHDQVSSLNSEISSEFLGKGRAAAASNDALRSLGLPQYDHVINLTHAELGCYVAHNATASSREGGLITSDREWLWHGDWHVYLVALLDFRAENQINLVDLYRGCGPRFPRAERPYIQRSLEVGVALPSGRRIAVNPGASKLSRCWRAEHFGKLCARLVAAGYQPILVGAPADRDVCARVHAASGAPILNVAGQTSVPQMATLLSQCDALISNDTGAVHIASAVGTPIVGLYGATAVFRETAPWTGRALILQGSSGADETSLDAISVDLVFASLQALLQRGEWGLVRTHADACGITAWRSTFESDVASHVPGLFYEAVHTEPKSAHNLFLQMLRHALAWNLDPASAAGAVHQPKSLSGSLDQLSVPELATDTSEVCARLRHLAVLALEARGYAAGGSVDERQRVQGVIDQMQSGQTLLLEQAQLHRYIFPPLSLMDWTLRTMLPSPPPQTFERYALEFERCARVLETAHRLTYARLHGETEPK